MHYNTRDEIPKHILDRQTHDGTVFFNPHGSSIKFTCESLIEKETVHPSLKEIALANAVVEYVNANGESRGFHTHDELALGGWETAWISSAGHRHDNGKMGAA